MSSNRRKSLGHALVEKDMFDDENDDDAELLERRKSRGGGLSKTSGVTLGSLTDKQKIVDMNDEPSTLGTAAPKLSNQKLTELYSSALRLCSENARIQAL